MSGAVVEREERCVGREEKGDGREEIGWFRRGKKGERVIE
jgi:hypothetical protein